MATNEVGLAEISAEQIMLKNFTKGKEQNIYNLVTGMDIYESLENFTITADIYIAEGIELMNNFPIGGEEHIEFTMLTPGKKACTYKLFVESIKAIKSNDASNRKTYILQCVTEDFLNNSFKLYSKRYKDMNYDAALQSVIQTELGSSVPIKTVEATKGKFDYIVNALRPFQVVDLILERSVSGGNKSSVYYFYQDNEGYHYTTLEKLITDRKGKAKSFEYIYDTSTRTKDYVSDPDTNFWNILSYNALNQGSSCDKVRLGSIRNQVREFNIYNGDYWLKNEYDRGHASYKATDNPNDFNSGAYTGHVAEKPAVSLMTVKDEMRPEMEHNKNVHWMRPFQSRVAQYGINIRVYGNTDMLVGDVIAIRTHDVSGVTAAEPDQQEIYSEHYVVREVKHTLNKHEDGHMDHYMTLDLRKPHLYGPGIS